MRYVDGPGPLAVAHRGGSGLAAENTLEAFRRSHALGVRYLETDVRATADGRLVAFHDATLDRATAGRGRVRDRTLDELTRIHVRGGTDTVLGLADLFAAFPDACFTVDVKEPAVIAPLARMLRAEGLAERVCLAGARGGWLRELAERTDGRVATALSWRALAQLASPRGRWTYGTAAFAHVPLRLGRLPVFRHDLLRRAHDSGVRVLVWTVNDAPTMHRLLDDGVDGIITDCPDVLREVLIRRGQWSVPVGPGLR
ncbi:glycerophosphodiester phosphodiesterase family protein [Jatrophihabitans endophyticus]|uniref:glycerophosphodiester phosphodiesterase family protein n=1 Tax=Jatrophihabitans endophyticus TaxID=1206085 RepID=UPI001A0AB847|nr:glycerophosphodiester phosphodiesterase family protein [Jatrophihabitans endophyticus]MBE7189243.1 glycerophosphodiester phosphodiesterase [Jatrophihabitans endophyticus]